MLNSLQGCRAVAALLVVFYHTSHGIFRLPKYFGHKPFGPIFDFGFAGVDFFFVLSGFIIMYAHARDLGEPRRLGAYLWKRFSRVYPAYWIVLAAILPVYFLIPDFGLASQRDPDVIARAIFLFPHPDGYPVLGVAWTLVNEIFFYAFFALLILNKRFGIAIFLAWSGLVIAYPWYGPGYGPGTYPASFLFSAYYLRFLAGLVVALVVQRWQVPMPRVVAAVGVALFLTTGLADSYYGPLLERTRMIGFTLGSALMIAGLVQAEKWNLIAMPRWLVYLGNASYSIYLVHFLALSILAKLAKAVHLDAMLPGTVLFSLHIFGAVGVGCLFHHLIEKPLHNWTRQKYQRPATPSLAIEPPCLAMEPAHADVRMAA